MANINAPDIEYFDSFRKELEGKFQRVKRLVDDRSASGNYHEEILKTVLRNFLSKRLSVKSGFIYAGPGKVSNQIDIMIIDENVPAAYIFQDGDFAIVLPESVVAIIEVKTTLDATQFDEAVNNIASAKKLIQYPTALPGMVFGYSSRTEPSDKNLNSWFKRPKVVDIANNPLLGPSAILFFSWGKLLMPSNEDGKIAWGGKYFYKFFREKDSEENENDGGWQLSIMLAIIITACERSDIRKTGVFNHKRSVDLVQSEGASVSNERFAFGEGISFSLHESHTPS